MKNRKQTSKDRQSIALAIDIGYGQVKLSYLDERGEITYMSFPSIAVPADPSLMRGLARSRNTFDVPTTGGGVYEVGIDITLAQTGNDFGREITDHWVASPIYEALMKGALRYQDQERIDMLYLGLPVSHYKVLDRQVNLAAMYQNREIDLGDGKIVSIGEVRIIPQPYGGYLELADHIDILNKVIESGNGQYSLPALQGPEELAELTMLVVDPGENTLDWLLVVKGIMNTRASDATSDAGRHRVVRAAAESLQAKLGTPVSKANWPRINDALRSDWKIKISGKIYDLREFEKDIRAVIKDPINRMIEGLKGLEDQLDVIGVVGGHPEFYCDELKRIFPHIPIYVSEGSIYANLRGFQALADEALRRQEAESEALHGA